MEGPPARGSGLYPLRRQISAARQVRPLYPLPIFRAGSSTDQNSWPTPNRCGFNSRTAHHAGSARRSSPRSITARCWFDSNILHQFDVEMGDWQRWQMHSTLNRDKAGSIPASPTRVRGLADMDMHSPFKRDEVGSIPTSRTRVSTVKRRHSITEQCAELLPRTMRVQISLPLPVWGCGPTDEGARLRTLRSEFNSLHPLHSLCSRGLRHDDASVLTKRSGLDSRREFQRVGSVTEQHGSVRSCKSGFDSRPAHQLMASACRKNFF